MNEYLTGVLAGVLLLPLAAYSAESDTTASAQAPSTLTEIVVTARKRSESANKIPIAVTAVTGETLEKAGVTSLEGLNQLTPSFSQVPAQDPGTNVITVRGITQVRFGEPPVALVIDGVQTASPDEATQQLYDIERVEVLKGPQGAIYGRDAIGGAINITTRPPSTTFENELEGEGGQGGYYRLGGTSSGPIASDLLYRVSGSYRSSDGRIDDLTLNRIADGYHAHDGRVRFLYTPLQALKIDLRANYDRYSGGSAYYYPIFHGQNINAVYPVVANRVGDGERLLATQSIKVDYDFAPATLTSITAHTKAYAATLGQDLDFLPYPLVPGFGGITLDQTRNVQAWSQEVRLTSRGNGPLQWLAGVYYLRTDRDVASSVFLDLGPGTSPRQGPRLSYLPEQNRNNAYAVFGNVDYSLTSSLKASLALREDWDARHQVNPANDTSVQKTFDSLQPKVSLTYFFAPDRMVYASAGRGFRSGGFNAQSQLFPRQYNAETATTYEAGSKLTLAQRRVQLNMAAFYTDQRNVQIYRFDATTGTQGILTINKAHHYGVEGDVHVLVLPRLELFSSASYIRSRIQDFNGTGLWDGNRLPHVPQWQYDAGTQYSWEMAPSWTVSARADLSSWGDLYWFTDNAAKQNSVWLLNLHLSVECDPVTFTLEALNVTDRRYDVDYFSSYFAGTPTDVGYPNPPRQINGKIAIWF